MISNRAARTRNPPRAFKPAPSAAAPAETAAQRRSGGLPGTGGQKAGKIRIVAQLVIGKRQLFGERRTCPRTREFIQLLQPCPTPLIGVPPSAAPADARVQPALNARMVDQRGRLERRIACLEEPTVNCRLDLAGARWLRGRRRYV